MFYLAIMTEPQSGTLSDGHGVGCVRFIRCIVFCSVKAEKKARPRISPDGRCGAMSILWTCSLSATVRGLMTILSVHHQCLSSVSHIPIEEGDDLSASADVVGAEGGA